MTSSKPIGGRGTKASCSTRRRFRYSSKRSIRPPNVAEAIRLPDRSAKTNRPALTEEKTTSPQKRLAVYGLQDRSYRSLRTLEQAVPYSQIRAQPRTDGSRNTADPTMREICPVPDAAEQKEAIPQGARRLLTRPQRQLRTRQNRRRTTTVRRFRYDWRMARCVGPGHDGCFWTNAP